MFTKIEFSIKYCSKDVLRFFYLIHHSAAGCVQQGNRNGVIYLELFFWVFISGMFYLFNMTKTYFALQGYFAKGSQRKVV